VGHPPFDLAGQLFGRPADATRLEGDRLSLLRPAACQRQVIFDVDDLDGKMPARAREVVVAERGDVPVAQLADRQDDDLQSAP